MHKKILMMLSALLLAGCATNARDCDPTAGDVSIITKFNCNSVSYTHLTLPTTPYV